MKWILSLSIIAIISFSIAPHSASAQAVSVVINEVELNPPGNDNSSSVREEVELYNPTSSPVDVGGWKVSSMAGRTATIPIPSGTIIPVGGFLIVGRNSQWLDNSGETIVLANSNGVQIDVAGPFNDDKNDSRSWQRYPDGSNDWSFRPSTLGQTNSPSIVAPTPTSAPPPNNPPKANAGPDLTVNEGTQVTLDGTSSVDPDANDSPSFSWVQISGPVVNIVNSNQAKASFTAPLVEKDSQITITLRVTDGSGATSEDNLTVIVKNIPSPTSPTSEDKDQLKQNANKAVKVEASYLGKTLRIIVSNAKDGKYAIPEFKVSILEPVTKVLTPKGWTMERDGMAIAFKTNKPIMPGKQVVFGIQTSKSASSFDWTALGQKDNVIAHGFTKVKGV